MQDSPWVTRSSDGLARHLPRTFPTVPTSYPQTVVVGARYVFHQLVVASSSPTRKKRIRKRHDRRGDPPLSSCDHLGPSHQVPAHCGKEPKFSLFLACFIASHDDRSPLAQRPRRGAGFSLWQKSRAKQNYGKIEPPAVMRCSHNAFRLRQPLLATCAANLGC